jgi:hypothetical protein
LGAGATGLGGDEEEEGLLGGLSAEERQVQSFVEVRFQVT